MRSKIATVAALIGVAFLSGACATSEQWAEWRAHTTHFASGEHGSFSLSNNMRRHEPQGHAPRHGELPHPELVGQEHHRGARSGHPELGSL